MAGRLCAGGSLLAVAAADAGVLHAGLTAHDMDEADALVGVRDEDAGGVRGSRQGVGGLLA
jgi:hypothetical protein